MNSSVTASKHPMVPKSVDKPAELSTPRSIEKLVFHRPTQRQRLEQPYEFGIGGADGKMHTGAWLGGHLAHTAIGGHEHEIAELEARVHDFVADRDLAFGAYAFAV